MSTLADKGSVASMFYLADAYATGRYKNERQIAEAIRWYSKLEALEWLPSEYMIGRLHLEGGALKAAASAFRKSASRDYTPGIYWLGACMVDGVGTSQDISGGIKLLDKAAKRGHLMARRKLVGVKLAGKAGPIGIFTV